MKAVLAHARLRLDVVSMKIFVWMFGHDGELFDSHLFFFDRYSELADHHRQQGRIAKADRLAAIAATYFQAAPDDDEPPKAAAMAMPVPRPMTSTKAVSATPVKKPMSEHSHVSGLGATTQSIGFTSRLCSIVSLALFVGAAAGILERQRPLGCCPKWNPAVRRRDRGSCRRSSPSTVARRI